MTATTLETQSQQTALAAVPAQAGATVHGIVDITGGRGYLRTGGYRRSAGDIPLSDAQLRRFGLRKGDEVTGVMTPRADGKPSPTSDVAGPRGAQPDDARPGGTKASRAKPGSPKPGNARPGRANAANAKARSTPGDILARIDTVNGRPAGRAGDRPRFADLTPVYPRERLRLEDGDPSPTARIIDLLAPIGKGQRGLIVAPPKAGKTTLLKTIARAVGAAHPEVHLMLVLVGERPEEVTDLRRSVDGEVVYSTFDQSPDDHVWAAELAIERAKRLAEDGTDVFVLLDSLTRLGRAYNLAAPAGGRTLTGGVAASALQPPRHFLGAARCLEEGGSVTIVSTVLVDTSSALDSVLFEEFKGTGNMEVRLRRDLAEKRLFPAIDPAPSGTRRDDLLMDAAEYAAVTTLRRALAGLDSQHALELLIDKTHQPNADFLRQVRPAR
ncbi:MAG TPA: transcription termination factor Rho [Trebonia sp.]|jgi:transcription termination factor Rho|nr:transcription termination factor Rho [Trebonia sp.]